MANNLFISYDLMNPGQRYPQVEAAIKQLGAWAKVHFSLYYVNSASTAEQAAKHVWASMDANDKLIVVDATNNVAYWFNLPADVAEQISTQWHR
jgi:hypothetical protein